MLVLLNALVLSVQGFVWWIVTLQSDCGEDLAFSVQGLCCVNDLVLSAQGFVQWISVLQSGREESLDFFARCFLW